MNQGIFSGESLVLNFSSPSLVNAVFPSPSLGDVRWGTQLAFADLIPPLAPPNSGGGSNVCFFVLGILIELKITLAF